MTSAGRHAVTMTDAEVEAVAIVTITTVALLPATMIETAVGMVVAAAMTTRPVASIDMLHQAVMTAIPATVEMIVVVAAEVVTTSEMAVEMVVAPVAMASRRPPGNLASPTEVDMTAVPMIGIPVNEVGQLMQSGAERPAK